MREIATYSDITQVLLGQILDWHMSHPTEYREFRGNNGLKLETLGSSRSMRYFEEFSRDAVIQEAVRGLRNLGHANLRINNQTCVEVRILSY